MLLVLCTTGCDASRCVWVSEFGSKFATRRSSLVKSVVLRVAEGGFLSCLQSVSPSPRRQRTPVLLLSAVLVGVFVGGFSNLLSHGTRHERIFSKLQLGVVKLFKSVSCAHIQA